jgi:hypothetical protein
MYVQQGFHHTWPVHVASRACVLLCMCIHFEGWLVNSMCLLPLCWPLSPSTTTTVCCPPPQACKEGTASHQAVQQQRPQHLLPPPPAPSRPAHPPRSTHPQSPQATCSHHLLTQLHPLQQQHHTSLARYALPLPHRLTAAASSNKISSSRRQLTPQPSASS